MNSCYYIPVSLLILSTIAVAGIQQDLQNLVPTTAISTAQARAIVAEVLARQKRVEAVPVPVKEPIFADMVPTMQEECSAVAAYQEQEQGNAAYMAWEQAQIDYDLQQEREAVPSVPQSPIQQPAEYYQSVYGASEAQAADSASDGATDGSSCTAQDYARQELARGNTWTDGADLTVKCRVTNAAGYRLITGIKMAMVVGLACGLYRGITWIYHAWTDPGIAGAAGTQQPKNRERRFYLQ